MTGAFELAPYALYRYFDARDILLYVGKTGELAQRISGHIARSRWMQFAARSTVERHGSAESVARAEREAIETEHPIFNKQYNDTPEARERLRSYLEEIGRLDLLDQKRADGDLIPGLQEGDAGIIDQIERILTSPCRHHALIRLLLAALIDGYRELPTGLELQTLAAKVHIDRASAYRLAQMVRKQAAAGSVTHEATASGQRLSHDATRHAPVTGLHPLRHPAYTPPPAGIS